MNTKRNCSVRSLTFETFPAKNKKNKKRTKKKQKHKQQPKKKQKEQRKTKRKKTQKNLESQSLTCSKNNHYPFMTCPIEGFFNQRALNREIKIPISIFKKE